MKEKGRRKIMKETFLATQNSFVSILLKGISTLLQIDLVH